MRALAVGESALGLHGTCYSVYDGGMAQRPHRLNVTLDPEHAAKLAQLAQRTCVQEGTLARSLLSQALDEAGADARNVAALLDGIPGAFERAHLGLRQLKAGHTVDLNEL